MDAITQCKHIQELSLSKEDPNSQTPELCKIFFAALIQLEKLEDVKFDNINLKDWKEVQFSIFSSELPKNKNLKSLHLVADDFSKLTFSLFEQFF